MDIFNDISDAEFVPFLNSLCVDSYKKSFEWMLSDPDYAGILRWLFNNLDQNNALNPREECHYIDLKKTGMLLSDTELEATLSSILDKHPGLPLPGCNEDLEDMEQDIAMMKERLTLLEKQETSLQSLIQQNDKTKDQLSSELTKLTSATTQCRSEEVTAGTECMSSAEGAARAASAAQATVAEALNAYADTVDKEISSKFFAFGPFESYRQSQALFRSHFDLFTSRKFSGREERRGAGVLAVEARRIEERLIEAATRLVESRAALAGERAKLSLAVNYTDCHPAQITVSCMEAKSAAELCSQEELILEEQIKNAAASLVERRARLRASSAFSEARGVREQILKDLTWLHDLTQKASVLDHILYSALRYEVRNLQDLVQFAGDLKDYVIEEENAVRCRIDTMNALCIEQETSILKHETKNYLLTTFCSIFGEELHEGQLVKLEGQLEECLRELRGRVEELRGEKEERIDEIKRHSQPIRQRVFDGFTRQPSPWSRSVAALSHSLTNRVREIDEQVVDASAQFAKIKNGDSRGLRKLWQYFLGDHQKLIATIRDVTANSYS